MKLQAWFGIVILIILIVSITLGSSILPDRRTTEPTHSPTDSLVTQLLDSPKPSSSSKVGDVTPRDATPSQVPRVSKGEAECRRVLSRIYAREFKTVRPDWLRSTETGRNLELDCYDEIPLSTLGYNDDGIVAIACEYQGRQHSVQVPMMQANESQFHTQQWNDEYKRRLCEIHGVHLILVPYTVKLPDIKRHIIAQLAERSLLPSTFRRQ